jgi:hypothetical protein
MSAITRTFAKPPFIGLLAFMIVFLTQGLGHTVMIMMEKLFGHEYVFQSAFAMGLLGAWLLWYGMKHNSEVAATWYGFFAGTFLWTGWVEFSFVAYARHLGVEPRMQGGEIVTLPEYLVMSSSLGILMATLVYFLFNKETKCNFFHWFQRNLGMSTGKPSRHHERNFASITALETIYVIWFFYLVLLIIYDETILGERHPVVYGLFFANVIWSVYLLQRLVRFWKVTTAIRYGIPTAIIAWNNVELLGRWNFFTEIWIHPEEYWLEMSLIFGAVIVITIVSMLTPQNAKSRLQQEQQART